LLDTGHATIENAARIAEAFVAARRAGTSIIAYPGPIPTNFATSYAIQEQAIALDGRAIAGWKVGRVHPPQSIEHGTDRLAGPIFDSSVSAASDKAAAMPVVAGGFAAVEAELLFRIDSLPDSDPRTLDDAAIMAHVGAVHIGIEIAGSPYARINSDGPLVTASDFGNNAGLVTGPELPDWQTRDLAAVTASVEIDGSEVGRADMHALPGGPVESVRFLLGHVATRPVPTPLPFLVSAGAISGVHLIAIGSTAVASFDDNQSIACRIVAASPQ
jgi:2-keto-4-pentenoate hydratase